jgi:cytochrome oxidase assembly protein ShyY1
VSLTGQFDANLQILIRNRTVEGRQGWEVVTPLLLADGSAVLVDRGWVPSARSGPTALPEVPEVPSGETTIIGRVRASEPGANPELRDGHWQSRRIGIAELGAKLPYRVAPVFVSADGDSTELVPIPVEHENDWLNFGYAFQWWLFAAGVFWAFYWLLRREHRQLSGAPVAAGDRLSGAPGAPVAAGDRLSSASGQGDVAQEESLGQAHSREFA